MWNGSLLTIYGNGASIVPTTSAAVPVDLPGSNIVCPNSNASTWTITLNKVASKRSRMTAQIAEGESLPDTHGVRLAGTWTWAGYTTVGNRVDRNCAFDK